MSTAPDPLAPFAAHVVRHMNEDHKDSLIAMVKHFTGLTVDQTLLMALDRLGMDCICIKDKERVKCRLPYTRYATLYIPVLLCIYVCQIQLVTAAANGRFCSCEAKLTQSFLYFYVLLNVCRQHLCFCCAGLSAQEGS